MSGVKWACVCVLRQTSTGKRKRADSIYSTKSHLSTGYRYRDGHLLNIVGSPVQESSRNYLFESFTGEMLSIFVFLLVDSICSRTRDHLYSFPTNLSNI